MKPAAALCGAYLGLVMQITFGVDRRVGSVSAAGSGVSGPVGRDRAGRGYLLCAGVGQDVVLAFPYDAGMVQEAKAIRGRRFNWETRTNVYPFARLGQVVAFADTHGIGVTDRLRSLVPAADAVLRQDGVGPAGQATRDAAHLYLDHGLWPVPAWAARDDGGCRCSRGTGCARPGKHPRSVPTGPGSHDYSWKPLMCATHEEVEQRFADGGRYASSNLMVAIPDGMLVVDQDFDDGGVQALEELAGRLGELPATLGHDTPHGTHRIYRTPAGWTTRAWVGKDARNPLPAGIDLRVPGQVLMAPPSAVPAGRGMAVYGPVADAEVVDLPAAYVAAWTPPKEVAAAGWQRGSSLPGRVDVAAAAYVDARISGITEDLAAIGPGGRNTAIYTAALKVGSTLGAARSLPGAEQAAWTDKAAENALLAAADQNGYIADHGVGAARSAIRSGLRNGLRDPRPLPGLTGRRAALATRARPLRLTAASARDSAVGPDRTFAGAEAGEPEIALTGRRGQGDPGDWRSAIVERERDEWALRRDKARPAAEVPEAEGGG
jgi:Bifunctional DNA primase/polymerase, N-terminal